MLGGAELIVDGEPGVMRDQVVYRNVLATIRLWAVWIPAISAVRTIACQDRGRMTPSG